MLNLQRMNMFVAVVDSGSFTAAATALGRTALNRSISMATAESMPTMMPLMVMLMPLRPTTPSMPAAA